MAINYFALLLAAVASMAVGYVWYGPLFGKKWMGYMGMTKESMDYSDAKKGMMKSYFISYASSLLMAYVLAYFMALLGAATFAGAFMLSVWIWLGFIVTTSLNSVLWEKKPWGYYFINISYQLVALAAMSLVLTWFM
jgi:hypothetical protein